MGHLEASDVGEVSIFEEADFGDLEDWSRSFPRQAVGGIHSAEKSLPSLCAWSRYCRELPS
jgi:hypothetical protein